MQDEVTTIARLYGEPDPDAGARERTLVRLRDAIASERLANKPAPRLKARRASMWIGAAAAVLVGVLVLQLLGLGSGSNGPARDQAGSSLRSLSTQAQVSTLTHRKAGLFLL